MMERIPRRVRRFFKKAMKTHVPVIRTVPQRMTDGRPNKSFMYNPVVIIDVTKTSVEYRHIYGTFEAKHLGGGSVDHIYWDMNWKFYDGPIPVTEEHFLKVMKMK